MNAHRRRQTIDVFADPFQTRPLEMLSEQVRWPTPPQRRVRETPPSGAPVRSSPLPPGFVPPSAVRRRGEKAPSDSCRELGPLVLASGVLPKPLLACRCSRVSNRPYRRRRDYHLQPPALCAPCLPLGRLRLRSRATQDCSA